MSMKAEEILDAAENRIRSAGYDGFSFREIAADVGVKSASVHYHFATKEALATAVAQRYRARFLQAVDAELRGGMPVILAWREVFRRSLHDDWRVCLCGVLGVVSNDLAPAVVTEVKAFFEAGLAQMQDNGISSAEAERVLSVLEGAMLASVVLGDHSLFDRVTASLGR
jgi:TetR/AcrR family transcriptional repressor of nem operon